MRFLELIIASPNGGYWAPI